MSFKELGVGVACGGGLGGGTMFMNANLSQKTRVDEAILYEEEENIPLSINNENIQWNKAHHRYFLEKGEDSKFHLFVPTDSERDQDKEINDKKAFKSGCRHILRKKASEVENEDFLKAKKWCLLYKPLSSEEGFDESKIPKEDDTFWTTKHSSLNTDTEIKNIVDKIKALLATDKDNKEKKSVYKWCKWSMDASVNYSLKDKVKTHCFKESS